MSKLVKNLKPRDRQAGHLAPTAAFCLPVSAVMATVKDRTPGLSFWSLTRRRWTLQRWIWRFGGFLIHGGYPWVPQQWINMDGVAHGKSYDWTWTIWGQFGGTAHFKKPPYRYGSSHLRTGWTTDFTDIYILLLVLTKFDPYPYFVMFQGTFWLTICGTFPYMCSYPNPMVDMCLIIFAFNMATEIWAKSSKSCHFRTDQSVILHGILANSRGGFPPLFLVHEMTKMFRMGPWQHLRMPPSASRNQQRKNMVAQYYPLVI